MRRAAPARVLVALALVACDGIGRPIVGPVSEPDGGSPRCEASPLCEPLPTFPPEHFAVPHAPPPIGGDCDGDEVDDARDNCPGVPNADQDPAACARAAADCARLVAGESAMPQTDLRGCAPAAPVTLGGSASLRGADLSCARLTLHAPASATVDLREIVAASARVSLTVGAASTVELGRSTWAGSALAVRGPARLAADDVVFDRATLMLEPGEASDAGPGLEIRRSDLGATTIWEAPSLRPGRVRVEASRLNGTHVDVRTLALYGTTIVASRLAAEQLDAQEVDIRDAAIRTDRGAFAGVTLWEVAFERCVDLRVTRSELHGVSVPACPPDRFRVFESELDGCNLAGGVELDHSHFIAGVLGGGPETTLTSRQSVLDGVRFCALGSARFHGGELRCTRCEVRDFDEGRRVCLAETSIFERGCPPIELAPTCG